MYGIIRKRNCDRHHDDELLRNDGLGQNGKILDLIYLYCAYVLAIYYVKPLLS